MVKSNIYYWSVLINRRLLCLNIKILNLKISPGSDLLTHHARTIVYNLGLNGNAAKKAQSDAIKKLSKKDKTFAKNYATLVKLRDKVEKDLKAKGIDPDEEARKALRNL